MEKYAAASTKYGQAEPRGGTQGVAKLYALAALWLTVSVLAAGLFISYFLPVGTRIPGLTIVLAALEADSHYKYLVPLLVPTTAWFVIANWVGWEYFRFA